MLKKTKAINKAVCIQLERGDVPMATAVTANSVEELAFTHWQQSANEKAYAAKLITKTMYEFARDELQKSIEYLSNKCYSV